MNNEPDLNQISDWYDTQPIEMVEWYNDVAPILSIYNRIDEFERLIKTFSTPNPHMDETMAVGVEMVIQFLEMAINTSKYELKEEFYKRITG